MKEWFSANDLVGLNGMPNSPQGVNKKARQEEWQKQQKSGTQGKAFEYHISSLPPEASQDQLRILFLQSESVRIKKNGEFTLKTG